MSSRLDPEIALVFAAAAEAGALSEMPTPDDVLALRQTINATLIGIHSQLPSSPDVQMTSFEAVDAAGTAVPTRWYTKTGTVAVSPAIVYVHGGGMVCGSAEIYDPLVRYYVQLTGIPFLSVDYRLAPEFSGVGLAIDVMVALRWLITSARSMGVDSSRIGIMGDSGGGGVAAGAAIMARDAGIALARQILVYPMLDASNTTPDPLLLPYATWTYDANHTAWSAVIGGYGSAAGRLPHFEPARLAAYEGLAPVYIEVGELDIFRDESLRYAQRLLDAGVSCELHVHPGSPHAFDWLAPASRVAKRALAARVAAIEAL